MISRSARFERVVAVVIALLLGPGSRVDALPFITDPDEVECKAWGDVGDVIGGGRSHDPNFHVVLAEPLSLETRRTPGTMTQTGTYRVRQNLRSCLRPGAILRVTAHCHLLFEDWLAGRSHERDFAPTCHTSREPLVPGFSREGKAVSHDVILMVIPLGDRDGATSDENVWRELYPRLEADCAIATDSRWKPAKFAARVKRWAKRHPVTCR